MKLETFLSTRDLKPSAFAEMAGLPASTISRILKGERSPGLKVLSKIMAASNGAVTANDFLQSIPTAEEAA